MITKLVRDKIPALFEADGIEHTVLNITVGWQDIVANKLREEIEELIQAYHTYAAEKDFSIEAYEHLLEEIADVMEVLEIIKNEFEFYDEDVDRRRWKKYDEKGGFEKKFVITY